jgi:hypothetical protein
VRDQRADVIGCDARRVEVCASLCHCVSYRSRAIGLEQLDETVAEAKASSKGAETRDAILAGGFGSEQLRPAFLRDAPIGHSHL